MADYKELLRRAVDALPENNGAARRAVYEKARAALVGQLRGIKPPLPARDITTHRLQLEDCIRQVEQEASEANIAGLGGEPQSPPTLPPVFATEVRSKAAAKPGAEVTARAQAKPEPAKPAPRPEAPARGPGSKSTGVPKNSIEDIIEASERDRGREDAPVSSKASEARSRPAKSQPVLVAKSEPAEPETKQEPRRPAGAGGKPLPSIVARAEAAKARPAAGAFSIAADAARRGPAIEPRRDARGAVAARHVDPMDFDVPEDLAAMAAVREVEVERQPADPQRTIDRAIAALESEARGEVRPGHGDNQVEMDDETRSPAKKNGLFKGRSTDAPDLRGEQRELKTPRPAKEFSTPRRSSTRAFPEGGVPRAQTERGGLGAVTIFLIIFVALLLGAGGAGFWALQEGFINLDAMFGKGTPSVATAAATQPVVTPDSTGPGNTATPSAATQPSTELKGADRLATADQPAVAPPATDAVAPLALQSPSGEAKTEERLGTDTAQTASTAEDAVAAIDPATVAGSQSLLLEASDTGSTGAVPFSGTVEWSKGQDETGQPTLIGKANIPARNLSVDLLIRKNSDPSLPASHLMEINFTVSDSFIGGSIAGLPGVLLKNEELVQGAPLVGASARVVGNSFLFALSATPDDNTANVNLLTSRKWMDLALIYASGKRAIITLEKDDKAEKLFTDVFAAWGKATTSAG